MNLLFVALWLLSAVASYGTWTAYFQGEYPRVAQEDFFADRAMGIFYGVAFGPVGLILSVFFSRFWRHGWRL